MSTTEPLLPVPPQNLEAEETVLGACLISDKAILVCSELLHPEQFYRRSHGRVFEAMLALYAAGNPVDPLTTADELSRRGALDEVGGMARVNELAAIVPASSNVAHYARIVAEHSQMRALIQAGERIAALARERQGSAEEILDRAEQAIFDATQARRLVEFSPLSSTVEQEYDRIVTRSEREGSLVGVPTGFRWLDSCTTGLLPGNLIVVAGRPSMGKSGLALCIAAHATLRADVPTALFSLEMGEAEIAQRLLASEAMIEATKLRTGKLDRQEWKRLIASCDRLSRAPLYIDDTGTATVTEIRSKARRLKMREPKLGLVIVDYLQLMEGGGPFESRVQEVSKISRSLKALARDLDLPVLAVSQLSRAPEQRHDKRPILSDLRESGAIEQDADIVAFVYRDDYYHPDDTDAPGIAEVNLAKHRNGPTTVVKLAFVKEYVKFLDLDWRQEAEAA